MTSAYECIITTRSFHRTRIGGEIDEGEIEVDRESNGLQQNANPTSEDSRSLLDANSRESSEITIETARLIKNEVSNQVTQKLDEIKMDSNSQILGANDSTISEKVLPSIQNTLRNAGEKQKHSNGPQLLLLLPRPQLLLLFSAKLSGYSGEPPK